MEFFNEHESYESHEFHEFYKRGGLREDKKIGYAELKVRGRKRKGGLCGLKKICENLSHLWSKKKRLPNPLTKAWERWM